METIIISILICLQYKYGSMLWLEDGIYIYFYGQYRTQFMLPDSSRRYLIKIYFYDEKVSHIYF